MELRRFWLLSDLLENSPEGQGAAPRGLLWWQWSRGIEAALGVAGVAVVLVDVHQGRDGSAGPVLAQAVLAAVDDAHGVGIGSRFG